LARRAASSARDSLDALKVAPEVAESLMRRSPADVDLPIPLASAIDSLATGERYLFLLLRAVSSYVLQTYAG
jgi:hypothetical protein